MFKIPLARPDIDNSEIRAVSKVIKSKWISSRGPLINKFELKFKNFLGGGYPVSVSNGTHALQLAITSIGLKPGDEIILPNLTFGASINAILNCGAKPVLVDVEKDTWTIDLNQIKKATNRKTKAIMLVHVYGISCKINQIKKFAKEKKLFLIEDCAEALGAKYKNKILGLHGDCSCHSFYANKTITTGEGGMVVFKKKSHYLNAIKIKNHGMSPKKKYFHDLVGSNYRLTNIQAAIGLEQLKKIKKLYNKRKNIFKIYDNLIDDNFFKKLPKNNWSVNSYWLYVVIPKKKINRLKLIKFFKKKGIEISTTFYPLHKMKPFKKYKFGKFLNSEYVGNNGICLPSSGLNQKEQIYIAKTLNNAIKLAQ
tara:strand:- start:1424 stop:2524 length:1101 start_codon:yes stop_codon:yes gene_type:complete